MTPHSEAVPESAATPENLIDAIASVCEAASIPALAIRLGRKSDTDFAMVTRPSARHPQPTLHVGEAFTDEGHAAVLGAAAHEIAHVALGHYAARLRLAARAVRFTFPVACLLALAVSAVLPRVVFWVPYPAAPFLALAAVYLMMCRVSRRYEYQADAHAIKILGRAGLPGRMYVTAALTCFLPDPAWHKRGGWLFVTHPPTGRRLAVIGTAEAGQ